MKVILSILFAASLQAQTVLINSGGPQQGAYAADNFYVGGSVYSDANLGVGQWKTQRYGTLFSYLITVPNGFYDVEVQMAEPNPAATAGKRIFNVAVNGELSPEIELFRLAGLRGHYSYKTQARVVDETLNVAFRGKVGNAVVNAILVKPAQRWQVSESVAVPNTPAGTKVAYRLQYRPVAGTLIEINEGGWAEPFVDDLYSIGMREPNPADPQSVETTTRSLTKATTFFSFVYWTEDAKR